MIVITELIGSAAVALCRLSSNDKLLLTLFHRIVKWISDVMMSASHKTMAIFFSFNTRMSNPQRFRYGKTKR